MDGHYTYLLLDENKNVVDIEGDIIQDKTVVEFFYDTDLKVDKHFKWTPIRTRYDKTESVNLFKQKYGNEMRTGLRILNSILYPVLFTDLHILSNDNTYKNHINVLTKREEKKQGIIDFILSIFGM